MTPALYLILTATPYVVPLDPGILPSTIPNRTSTKNGKQIIRQHKEDCRISIIIYNSHWHHNKSQFFLEGLVSFYSRQQQQQQQQAVNIYFGKAASSSSMLIHSEASMSIFKNQFCCVTCPTLLSLSTCAEQSVVGSRGESLVLR